MEIGKKYKILGTSQSHRPDLQPEGTIIECVEDKDNGFYVIRLIDNCGKEIEEGIWGWLTEEKKKN